MSLKDLMADLLDKDFKINSLKDMQRIKGRCEKSQENRWTKWKYNKEVENLKKKPERNPGAEKYNNW